MTQAQAAQRLIAGRYRLIGELGRGGMGVVWRATDELIGRPVAVKEIRPPAGLAAPDRALLDERALREARAAGRINHPAVVAVHDVVPATVDDDAVYIITELVDGPTLAEVVGREGVLRADRVAAIAVQVLDALDAAHTIGVVHRDVKPSNIMVLGDDTVKLVDFGIAHATDDIRLTRAGVVGSTGYIAPELFHGADPTPASDLWSLGATLFHAAEGHGPFDRGSAAAALHAVLYDDVPPARCRPPLASVIDGLLTRDVGRRMTSRQVRPLLRDAARRERDTPAGGRDATPPHPRAPDQDSPSSDRDGALDERRRAYAQIDACLTALLARERAAQGGALWEEQPTNIRATPSASPSGPGEPGDPPAKTTFPVLPTEAVAGGNRLILAVLVGLTVWAGWEVLHEALGAGLLATIWFSALSLAVSAGTVHRARTGPATITRTGLNFAGAVLEWESVRRVVVAPAAAPRQAASVVFRLAPGTPAALRSKPPFAGFVRDRPGQKPGFLWSPGDFGADPGTVTAALREVAPPSVVVAAAKAGDTDRYSGPRRGWSGVWVLALVTVLIGGYTYQHQHRNPVRLAESWVDAVAFSPDGATLASADDDEITVWDVTTRKKSTTLSVGPSSIDSLIFSPDGIMLASSSFDGAITLWDVSTGRRTATITTDQDDGCSSALRFSRDATVLAGVCPGSKIELWRLAAPDKPVTITENTEDVTDVGFSTDGRTLYGIDNQDRSRFWDAATGHSTKALTGGSRSWVSAETDHSIEVLDAGSGKVSMILHGHTATIKSLATGDGDLVASSSDDHTIRIWHTATGETAQTLTLSGGAVADDIALSPDGGVLAYSYDGLWLWKTGLTD